MAAKTWEADFRSAAIQASLRLVGRDQYEDIFEAPESFCLPVAHKPIVGCTPGWFMLIGQANRRILIEGIGARYQIRAEDVVRLLPFQFMNYVGVEVLYRIGSEAQLRLAIARPSLLAELIRQAPILSFLRNRCSNRLLERFSQTLGTKEGTAMVPGR